MRKIKRTFCANTVIGKKNQIHNIWQAAARGQNIILGETWRKLRTQDGL